MTLPKAIREAGERADAAIAAMNQNTAKPALETPEQPQAPAVAPTSQQEPQPEAPKAEAAAPQPDKPVAPQQNAGEQQPESIWETRYRVLSNKYSAEVPRMAQEIRGLKEQLRKKEEQQPPATDSLNGLTPEKVVETYGEDFAKAVAAIVSKTLEAKVRDEIAPRVEAVASQVSTSNRSQFFQQLANAVPGYEVIDQDPAFTAWLDEIDQLSGLPRRAFFEDADAKNDHVRVASFFTTFKNKSAAQVSQQQQVASNAVEYAMAPTSSRVDSPPVGKKIWTQAEVREFYKQARRGMYSQADMERIDADIVAATNEGRYVAA